MTTVTSILKYLEMNSQNMDQNMDMHSRPKKRRLDHLTWEEKMQRKKLKNRVAAQTSRDRKKAKMEQMEHAVEQLFEQTEALREVNERLARENAELLARLEAPCEACRERKTQNRPVDCEALDGSTESLLQQKGGEMKSHPVGSASAETRAELPSLQDLLDELQSDVDIDSLEQLAHGLLQDVARDLEDAAQEANSQESVDHGQMVGQTPAQLEPAGSDLLAPEEDDLDVSEYLLLHHNYAAKPPASPKKPKLKPIRPKPASPTPVTILVMDDLTRQVDAVTCCSDCPSPVSCASSDRGYESVGSPGSVLQDDLWDQSISELFPSLI